MKNELEIYKKRQSILGIPKLYGYSTEDDYNILVVELLGKNLETLFRGQQKHISLISGVILADQMVRRGIIVGLATLQFSQRRFHSPRRET